MTRTSTRKLVTAALMCAIGLILPFVSSHAFGVPGTVLLPMHLPVLLCGLLCGPAWGAATGVLVPVLSGLLTGMPPLLPMMPVMALQLCLMGFVSGLCHRQLRWPALFAVAAAIPAGLAGYALGARLLLFAGVGAAGKLSVLTALVQGLPGIAIQLVLLPLLLRALQKRGIGALDEAAPAPQAGGALAQAKGIIKSGEATCVVIRDEAIVHTAEGRGVKPLLNLYDNQPATLRGATVADKIIGKGAAVILVLGGAAAVYGEVMSRAGREYLEAHGIPASYGRCVDMLSNRDQTGICPIEQSVLDVEDAEAGLARIRETIQKLMQSAG